jgi:hypothetical protein
MSSEHIAGYGGYLGLSQARPHKQQNRKRRKSLHRMSVLSEPIDQELKEVERMSRTLVIGEEQRHCSDPGISMIQIWTA